MFHDLGDHDLVNRQPPGQYFQCDVDTMAPESHEDTSCGDGLWGEAAAGKTDVMQESLGLLGHAAEVAVAQLKQGHFVHFLLLDLMARKPLKNLGDSSSEQPLDLSPLACWLLLQLSFVQAMKAGTGARTPKATECAGLELMGNVHVQHEYIYIYILGYNENFKPSMTWPI